VGRPGRRIRPVASAQALAHAHAEHPTRRPAVTSDSDHPVVQIGYLRTGCGPASVTYVASSRRVTANESSDIRVIISAYRTENISDDHPYI